MNAADGMLPIGRLARRRVEKAANHGLSYVVQGLTTLTTRSGQTQAVMKQQNQ